MLAHGMGKPIVAVDFDGVLHAYTTGWHGPAVVADGPVLGALEWLVKLLPHFDVAVHSARSSSWAGRSAMRTWMRKHLAQLFMECSVDVSLELMRASGFSPGMDRPDVEAQRFAQHVVRRVQWPKYKPPAHLTVDDRAHCFTGVFPTAEQIRAFTPWNKSPRAVARAQGERSVEMERRPRGVDTAGGGAAE